MKAVFNKVTSAAASLALLGFLAGSVPFVHAQSADGHADEHEHHHGADGHANEHDHHHGADGHADEHEHHHMLADSDEDHHHHS